MFLSICSQKNNNNNNTNPVLVQSWKQKADGEKWALANRNTACELVPPTSWQKLLLGLKAFVSYDLLHLFLFLCLQFSKIILCYMASCLRIKQNFVHAKFLQTMVAIYYHTLQHLLKIILHSIHATCKNIYFILLQRSNPADLKFAFFFFNSGGHADLLVAQTVPALECCEIRMYVFILMAVNGTKNVVWLALMAVKFCAKILPQKQRIFFVNSSLKLAHPKNRTARFAIWVALYTELAQWVQGRLICKIFKHLSQTSLAFKAAMIIP